MQLFDKFGQSAKGVVFKRGMENMLGKPGVQENRGRFA